MTLSLMEVRSSESLNDMALGHTDSKILFDSEVISHRLALRNPLLSGLLLGRIK